MIPDPSSPKRYRWLPILQAEARIAQLEQEQATLQTELDTLKDAIAPYRHTPEDGDLWREPYDFIREVRNMRDVGELNTRLSDKNERLEAALGETRQALQQLTEKYGALVARVDTPGISDALVPQPPVGDTSTDR